MCISLPPYCLYSHYITELLLLEVLIEMAMKRTIFWDVIPYHLGEVHLAGYFLGLLFNPEGGDRMFLWSISKLFPDYMMLHSRRHYLSSSLFCCMLCSVCCIGDHLGTPQNMSDHLT